MAYGIPWDEAAPSGATTPADTIDTELQNLKISIRERIEDVICDWTDDSVQPKELCEGLFAEALGSQFVFIQHEADSDTDVVVASTEPPVYLTITGTTDSASQLVIDFSKVNGGIYKLAQWSLMTEKVWGGDTSTLVPLYVEAMAENGEVMLLLLKKEGGDGGYENKRVQAWITIVNKNPLPPAP